MAMTMAAVAMVGMGPSSSSWHPLLAHIILREMVVNNDNDRIQPGTSLSLFALLLLLLLFALLMV